MHSITETSDLLLLPGRLCRFIGVTMGYQVHPVAMVWLGSLESGALLATSPLPSSIKGVLLTAECLQF